MAKQKIKVWTPKQIERLPEEGYWMEWYPGVVRPTVICNRNGAIKYIQYAFNNQYPAQTEWFTLLWSCCFTKNQIAKPKDGETYQHFLTIQDMKAAYPNLPLIYHTPAPNDY